MAKGCTHGAFAGEVDQSDGSITVTCGRCGDAAVLAKGVQRRGAVHQIIAEQFGPRHARQVTDIVMSCKANYQADKPGKSQRTMVYEGTPTHLLLHFGKETTEPRLVCLKCFGNREPDGFIPLTFDEFLVKFKAFDDELAQLRWFFCVVCERAVFRANPKDVEKVLRELGKGKR